MVAAAATIVMAPAEGRARAWQRRAGVIPSAGVILPAGATATFAADAATIAAVATKPDFSDGPDSTDFIVAGVVVAGVIVAGCQFCFCLHLRGSVISGKAEGVLEKGDESLSRI